MMLLGCWMKPGDGTPGPQLRCGAYGLQMLWQQSPGVLPAWLPEAPGAAACRGAAGCFCCPEGTAGLRVCGPRDAAARCHLWRGPDSPTAHTTPLPWAPAAPRTTAILPARGGGRWGPAKSPGKGPGREQAGQLTGWSGDTGGHSTGRPRFPAGCRAPRLAEPRGQEGATRQGQPRGQPWDQDRCCGAAGPGPGGRARPGEAVPSQA